MEYLTVYQSPVAKERIGNFKDGGYAVLMLPGTYDCLLSGGISDNVTFEQHFLEKFPGVPAYGFDGTVDNLPDTVEGLEFVKKNVGIQNTETLTDLVEYFKDKKDVFFKMDIEGCEFEVMPNLIEKGLVQNIKQIVLEIHTPCDIHRFPDYYSDHLKFVTNDLMFDILKKLDTTHTLVHFHGNNVWNKHYPDQIFEGAVLPFVYELTYVRNEYVPERKKNTFPIPGPLDCTNSDRFPDYKMTGWPYIHDDSVDNDQ